MLQSVTCNSVPWHGVWGAPRRREEREEKIIGHGFPRTGKHRGQDTDKRQIRKKQEVRLKKIFNAEVRRARRKERELVSKLSINTLTTITLGTLNFPPGHAVRTGSSL